jgi:hypothetical protein
MFRGAPKWHDCLDSIERGIKKFFWQPGFGKYSNISKSAINSMCLFRGYFTLPDNLDGNDPKFSLLGPRFGRLSPLFSEADCLCFFLFLIGYIPSKNASRLTTVVHFLRDHGKRVRLITAGLRQGGLVRPTRIFGATHFVAG